MVANARQTLEVRDSSFSGKIRFQAPGKLQQLTFLLGLRFTVYFERESYELDTKSARRVEDTTGEK